MNNAVRNMLEKHACESVGDYVAALREILQSIALLGLWRSKFFERAAFYGGTALRLLYGLDRYSEDLDFSLVPGAGELRLSAHNDAIRREMESFGFGATVETRRKKLPSPIESAFVKSNTRRQLLVIEAEESVVRQLPRNQVLTIRLEVDTEPPGDFATDTKYLLQPVPFSVRAFALPDLFAGKVHALLCRNWRSRVKGRDWYDLVWYVSRHPALHLAHLEQRMRQSGHHTDEATLERPRLMDMLAERVTALNIAQVKAEVSPYLKDDSGLAVWSREFFLDVIRRIEIV